MKVGPARTRDNSAPRCRSFPRSCRWCVVRTFHDARLAAARGRPIPAHHLRRLAQRRFAAVLSRVEQGFAFESEG